ncbi:hypothetical protein CsSME_00033626 [Camellia sinensis var. sinensis]
MSASPLYKEDIYFFVQTHNIIETIHSFSLFLSLYLLSLSQTNTSFTGFTNPTAKIHYLYYQWIIKVCRNREGYEPQLAAVATGSHIDAIPYSGKYDGVVGVLGAIQAINVLKRRKATKKITWVKVNEKAHGLHDQKGDIVLDIADIQKGLVANST